MAVVLHGFLQDVLALVEFINSLLEVLPARGDIDADGREELVWLTEDDLMLDPLRSPACIPAHYVTAVCEAPAGAWPLGLADAYDADEEELRRYTSMARTEEGFRAYLDTSEPRVAAAE